MDNDSLDIGVVDVFLLVTECFEFIETFEQLLLGEGITHLVYVSLESMFAGVFS